MVRRCFNLPTMDKKYINTHIFKYIYIYLQPLNNEMSLAIIYFNWLCSFDRDIFQCLQ